MPVEIQARIASIQSRFATAPTNASTKQSSEFTAALASVTAGQTEALFGSDAGGGADLFSSLLGTSATGQTSGASALSTLSGGLGALGGAGLSSAQQQLIASGLASRNAALGISGIGSAGQTTDAGASAAAGRTGAIASKSAVERIESTLTNGRLDTAQLSPIGVGSHKLHPEAAGAFKQMMAAAKADGVDFGVTDSYRSYDAQVDVARRKGLYSQGGLAAKPGTSSHGYGLAVDLDLNSKALNWMRTNAGRFGFVEDTPRETWHWKFDGV